MLRAQTVTRSSVAALCRSTSRCNCRLTCCSKRMKHLAASSAHHMGSREFTRHAHKCLSIARRGATLTSLCSNSSHSTRAHHYGRQCSATTLAEQLQPEIRAIRAAEQNRKQQAEATAAAAAASSSSSPFLAPFCSRSSSSLSFTYSRLSCVADVRAHCSDCEIELDAELPEVRRHRQQPQRKPASKQQQLMHDSVTTHLLDFVDTPSYGHLQRPALSLLQLHLCCLTMHSHGLLLLSFDMSVAPVSATLRLPPAAFCASSAPRLLFFPIAGNGLERDAVVEENRPARSRCQHCSPHALAAHGSSFFFLG